MSSNPDSPAHSDESTKNLASSWDYADPYVISLTVQQRHIDLLGHVNNVHYLNWLQQCAWAHSTARGISEEKMVALDRAMVVRETRMQYLAAAFLDDELCVGDWITASDGKLRATRSFQIIRVKNRQTLMRATIDYVCMRISSGRPTRMPEAFVQAYANDVRSTTAAKQSSP